MATQEVIGTTDEGGEGFGFRIARVVDGTHVEITFANESKFSEAIELLEKLCDNVRIRTLKIAMRRFWSGDGSSAMLSDMVTDRTHRVALSLFRSWPQSKQVSNIQMETGLPQSSVSNILAGRQGNAGQWFVKHGNSWSLSEAGMRAIVDAIVPSLLVETQESAHHE